MLMVPCTSFAADITASTDFNATRFALISIIIVLIAANGLLANVLLQLAFALREKSRAASGTILKSIALFAVLLVPSYNVFAQDVTEEPVAPAVTNFISGIPKTEFYFLVGLAGFLFAVMLVLILLIRMLLRELRGIPFKAHLPARIFQRNFLDFFNKSVPVQNEQAIVLEHDYDGIRELDNDLPPWWKWGFVVTIVVAFVYVGYYQLWGGPNQIDEYKASVAKAEIEMADYLAKSGEKIDETNVKLITDPTALSTAKALFANTCAACHGADAGGSVGPNLTDEYWLHGGSLQDVFKSIKYGWKDKGMPAWDKNLSAKQIQDLANFVESLKGTKPANPKPPQGDLYKALTTATQDSTNDSASKN